MCSMVLTEPRGPQSRPLDPIYDSALPQSRPCDPISKDSKTRETPKVGVAGVTLPT